MFRIRGHGGSATMYTREEIGDALVRRLPAHHVLAIPHDLEPMAQVYFGRMTTGCRDSNGKWHRPGKLVIYELNQNQHGVRVRIHGRICAMNGVSFNIDFVMFFRKETGEAEIEDCIVDQDTGSRIPFAALSLVA